MKGIGEAVVGYAKVSFPITAAAAATAASASAASAADAASTAKWRTEAAAIVRGNGGVRLHNRTEQTRNYMYARVHFERKISLSKSYKQTKIYKKIK